MQHSSTICNREAQICGIACFSVEQIIMIATLPLCGCGCGGPNRRGGRDGGRGCGGQGGPLPCRTRNSMLVSILKNSTIAASISPLTCTPAPLAALPPPPPAVARPQYAIAVVQVQGCGNPCGANPSSRRTTASHGTGKKEKPGDGMTEEGEGAWQTTLSPSIALPLREGEGPYSTTTTSFAIRDRCVPRLAGIHPRHRS